MKVFGIGLSRTGTHSLTFALRKLGINVVHYPDDEETFYRLRNGIYDLPCLENRDGITDVQGAAFYKQFDKQYPGSKFILTIRDKDDWLRSTKKKFRAKSQDYILNNRNGFALNGSNSQWLRAAVYKVTTWDREVFSEVYDQHIFDCIRYFGDRLGKDLLIMNINQGWEPLCKFLDKSIPGEEFPWAAKSNV